MFKPKKLPFEATPQYFNYFDYQKAWQYTFFLQNREFHHSWMIYLDNKFNFNIPLWFLDWWKYFGPAQEILPQKPHNILSAYSIFQERVQPPVSLQAFPKLFLFFANFGLAWIMFWKYEILSTQVFPSLGRTFHVKWWEKAKIQHVTPTAIQQWFNRHPSIQSTIAEDSSKVLLSKSQLIAKLAAAPPSCKELKRHLQEALSSLQSEEEEDDQEDQCSSSSVDLAQDNEDDCFGILSPIPRH